MRITAITRFKHGDLYAILQRLGWTQSELARKTGITPTKIGAIINLVRRPRIEEADAIQHALGEAGEYLDVLAEWPETFKGIRPGFRYVQSADVSVDALCDHPEVLQIAAPPTPDTTDLDKALEEIVGELPALHQATLRERFWKGKTATQAGREREVTRSAESYNERKALRLLRKQRYLDRLAAERY